MKCISFILLIVFLAVSCKKDKLNGDKEILIGKWEWEYSIIKTSTCNPPESTYKITPLSENVRYTIEFLKKGIVKFYKNDQLIEDYRIVFSQWSPSTDPRYKYDFNIKLDNSDEISLGFTVSTDSIYVNGAVFMDNHQSGNCSVQYDVFRKLN